MEQEYRPEGGYENLTAETAHGVARIQEGEYETLQALTSDFERTTYKVRVDFNEAGAGHTAQGFIDSEVIPYWVEGVRRLAKIEG